MFFSLYYGESLRDKGTLPAKTPFQPFRHTGEGAYPSPFFKLVVTGIPAFADTT